MAFRSGEKLNLIKSKVFAIAKSHFYQNNHQKMGERDKPHSERDKQHPEHDKPPAQSDKPPTQPAKPNKKALRPSEKPN